MPSSRGLHVFAFYVLLVQVFSSATAQGSLFPTEPRYFGSQFGESREPKEQPPSSQPEHHYHEPRHPAQEGPDFTEDDLFVLIGTDLQVPYPLYRQISNSFLSSKDILVLLPNNTIVTVSGFAELNDITKADPEGTKVLISSDSMIPAPIYLRIVLIQPEEVMVKLPNGEILPNKICQELFDKKVPTTESGGQTYYTQVDDQDSFPFLLVNDRESEDANESVPPPPSNADEYPYSGLNFSGIDESMPFYGPELVREFHRPFSVPYFSDSPVQEPERWSRSLYRELAPRYQNRFRSPHPDSRRNHGERMVLLPPGIHIMDLARCGICDSNSPEKRIRILTV